MSTKQILSEKSLVTVFVYVPAGLGHLRVTEALYHGFPEESAYVLLGSQDKSTQFFHRILSIHPFFRYLMTIFQYGALEDIFTFFYRGFLRSRSQLLYSQLLQVFDERIVVPKTILIVASHFGHAYELAAIKKKFAKEKNVKVYLVVQVTDDSPQYIWYVAGADIIFVPSDKTKRSLEAYGKLHKYPQINFIVNAYPVSPLLATNLSFDKFHERLKQLTFLSKAEIHVAVPISGAAVGTNTTESLIDNLHFVSPRYHFHVVSKSAPYTNSFLHNMLTRQYVSLSVSTHDREIVAMYEQLYENNVVALELTKPSEQTFKALLAPRKRGGAILLFEEPVGRQEFDNLDFLRRHGLLPSIGEKNYLARLAEKNEVLKEDTANLLRQNAKKWRGLELPKNPVAATRFIEWCLRVEIFLSMCHYEEVEDIHANEVNPNGVSDFWNIVAKFITEKKDVESI